MPFVIPPSSTDLETLELDGLHLNSDEIGMEAVAFPPPRQRAEWIGAADSEWQALARNPLHENREITANLVVVGGDKDGMLQRVGEIVDKLQKASQYQDGIELVWSPGGSTLQVTFDVLSGQITEMAVDVEWNFSHVAKLTVVMTCKPYWRGEETLSSTTSGSLPALTAEIANLVGDIPALGRLIVTDTASQSRRHVEWGLEGPLTYNPSTVLLLDSDDLVTSGFAGSQTTLAGTYDPNASGNNAISAIVQTTPTAICGTGSLAHVGAFRVKARINSGTGSLTCSFRLAWRVGGGPYAYNSPASVSVSSQGFYELDLGVITVPQVVSGTQAWDGRLEAWASSPSQTVYVDYLTLVPVTDGYGKARASYSYTAGVLTGFDNFTGTTAGSALNGRTAVSGGTWATSGSTTDFAFADDLSGEQVKRSTSSDAGPRWAILGSTNFTDTQVETTAIRTTFGSGGVTELGVVARWTDSSNYLRLVAQRDSSSNRFLILVQRVAGTDTTLASADIPNSWVITATNRLRLIVFASGRALGYFLDPTGNALASVEVSASALATGGTLASGKPVIYDYNATATSVPRYYDDFQVSTPAAEPIVLYSGQSMEFRHDDTVREDSSGTYYGRPQSYRGSRFLVPVGTSRVLVKARRNDIDTGTDDNVTDATQIQIGVTARGLVVPRG